MSWHIYSLTDPRDGRVRYVGKTTRPKGRLHSHICEAIRGRQENHRTHWVRSVIEAGHFPTMSILESGEGDWQAAEQKWIKTLRDAGCNLVNSTDGGDGVYNPTPEVRAKIGAASRVRRDSPETKAKKSAASKARWTPEYRAKWAETRRKLWQTPEYRAKRAASLNAVLATPEHRAKIGATSRALWQSPEYRTKMLAKRKEQGARPEFRAKMKSINKGHWESAEYRDKHARAMANVRAKCKENVA